MVRMQDINVQKMHACCDFGGLQCNVACECTGLDCLPNIFNICAANAVLFHRFRCSHVCSMHSCEASLCSGDVHVVTCKNGTGLAGSNVSCCDVCNATYECIRLAMLGLLQCKPHTCVTGSCSQVTCKHACLATTCATKHLLSRMWVYGQLFEDMCVLW